MQPTTTAQHLTPEFVSVWTKNLANAAAGLDFADAEDRSTFRLRVEAATRHTLVTAIRELAAHLGSPVSGNSTRTEATRAIAAAFIASQEGK